MSSRERVDARARRHRASAVTDGRPCSARARGTVRARRCCGGARTRARTRAAREGAFGARRGDDSIRFGSGSRDVRGRARWFGWEVGGAEARRGMMTVFADGGRARRGEGGGARCGGLTRRRTRRRARRWFFVATLALAVTAQTLVHGRSLRDVSASLSARAYASPSAPAPALGLAERRLSEEEATTGWMLSSARHRARTLKRRVQGIRGDLQRARSSLGEDEDVLIVAGEDAAPSSDTQATSSDITYEIKHRLLNADFRLVYEDLLKTFECAKECALPKSSPFPQFCNATVHGASNSEFLKCVTRECGCYEGFELREALFYVCEISGQEEHFDGVDYATFLRDVAEDAEEECAKKYNVMTFHKRHLPVDNTCEPEKDMEKPTNCAAQEDLSATCEFSSTSCGEDAEQVGPFVPGRVREIKWNCPVFRCSDDTNKCSWETEVCESEAQYLEAKCRRTVERKGKCAYCDLGWRLDEKKNKCVACEPGYNKVSKNVVDLNGRTKKEVTCQLDEEKLVAAVNAELENITSLGENYADLGLLIRQNSKLGWFWDDWKRELDGLVSQVQSIVAKIVRLKDDVARLIHDIGNAIVALGKDLWGLAQKCGAIVSDLLDTIIPAVDGLLGGVKDALICDMTATSTSRLGESRLGKLAPRYDHEIERKLAEVFYGKELAKIMVPEPAPSLGNQCPVIPCLTSVCEEVKMEHEIDESTNGFGAPFPKKGSKMERRLSKMTNQVKASIKVRVMGQVKTCVGLTDFSISFSFAKDIADSFMKVIKPAFDASVRTLTEWTDRLTDGIKAAKNWVENAYNTVDNAVRSIPGFGRRRLLKSGSDKEAAYWDDELEKYADFGRLENVYMAEVRELERQTRKQLEIIKSMHSGEDLYLAAQRHHEAQQTSAELGGIMDGDALIGAMTDAFRLGMKAISFNLRFKVDMNAQLELDATAELFRTGDFTQGKVVKNFRKFSSLGYGFYIIVEGALKLTLPYYFLAQGTGHFEYKLTSEGLFVDLGLSDGEPRLVFPTNPKVKLENQATASVSASIKMGVMAEVENFSITLCWAGLVCTGPVIKAGQPVYVGADVIAAAHTGHNQCFNGRSKLEAIFAERFTGYGNDANCRLRTNGALAGAGWYSEFPGVAFDLDLITKTNLGSQCELKLDLYEAPKFDYTAPISHHACASSGSGDFVSTTTCDTTASAVDADACPKDFWKAADGTCYESCYNTKTQCGNHIGRNGVYCAYKSPVCARTDCGGSGGNMANAPPC